MSDQIVRAIAKEAGVLAMACVATEVTREVVRRHQATPLAAAVLGYGLSGAALMGALLKLQQRVAIKVEGNGPVGKLVVESDSYGRVRGYIANAQTPAVLPIDQEMVADAVGRLGLLTVVKDVGLKQLYEGVVPLQTGDVIPVGALVDATKGRVTVTTALPNGSRQASDFYQGIFRVTQAKSGLATMVLAGGSFGGCGRTASVQAAVAKLREAVTDAR